MPGAAASDSPGARLRPSGIVDRRAAVIVAHTSEHHSQTLPCMSHSPKRFGGNFPTGTGELGRPVLGDIEFLDVRKRRSALSSPTLPPWPGLLDRRRCCIAWSCRRGRRIPIRPRSAIDRSCLPCGKPLAEGVASFQVTLMTGSSSVCLKPRFRQLNFVSRPRHLPRAESYPSRRCRPSRLRSCSRFVGEAAELPDRHLILAELKRLGDSHPMPGIFVLEEVGRTVVGGKRSNQSSADSWPPIRNSPAGTKTSFMPIELLVSATFPASGSAAGAEFTWRHKATKTTVNDCETKFSSVATPQRASRLERKIGLSSVRWGRKSSSVCLGRRNLLSVKALRRGKQPSRPFAAGQRCRVGRVKRAPPFSGVSGGARLLDPPYTEN